MTTLNRIQQELKAIGQGRFQKLCDAYLHKEGYRSMWSLGSVIGANKTRAGRPDTLISTPQGKYVLVEMTTTQDSAKLIKKLQDDLADCLDPEKTGIDVSEIDEIILCFNSDIDHEAQKDLTTTAQKHGCRLSLCGITKLSFALYQDYPNLAKDFLDISVDTGQILDVRDFIEHHGRNKRRLTPHSASARRTSSGRLTPSNPSMLSFLLVPPVSARPAWRCRDADSTEIAIPEQRYGAY